jgi:hypothetical protein
MENMADFVLMFGIYVLISHVVKWLKPQDGWSSGYLIVWIGYFSVILVLPELLAADEIFSRAFFYSSSIIYHGLSSILFRYCGRVIVLLSHILHNLRIWRIKKRKRIPGITVIFQLVLLGGWPPPTFKSQIEFFFGSFLWYGIILLVWIILCIGLLCGTGSTMWDPGLSLDLISDLHVSSTNNIDKNPVVLVNIIFPAMNVKRPLIMTVILSVCALITQPTGVTLIIANKSTIAYISFILSSLTAKFPTGKNQQHNVQTSSCPHSRKVPDRVVEIMNRFEADLTTHQSDDPKENIIALTSNSECMIPSQLILIGGIPDNDRWPYDKILAWILDLATFKDHANVKPISVQLNILLGSPLYMLFPDGNTSGRRLRHASILSFRNLISPYLASPRRCSTRTPLFLKNE